MTSTNIDTYEQYRFRPNKVAAPAEVLIAESPENSITTAGNITVITGPPKSGKTAVAGAILAGNITEKPTIDTLGLTITSNIAMKGVIYINTELGDSDFRKFNENVLKRAKCVNMPEFYFAYNFTGLTNRELKESTDRVIQIVQAKIGIRIIVIDGIADYVSSVNNEEESNEIVRYFHDLAKKFGIGVVLIIHKNPGIDQKSRGHLGSQLERKCETMLEVYSKNGLSTLASKFARNSAPFDPICFKHDRDLGYHAFVGRKSGQTETGKATKKQKVETREKDFLRSYGKEGENVPFQILLQNIQDEFKVKKRTANSRIAKWKELGWLETTQDGYRILIRKEDKWDVLMHIVQVQAPYI